MNRWHQLGRLSISTGWLEVTVETLDMGSQLIQPDDDFGASAGQIRAAASDLAVRLSTINGAPRELNRVDDKSLIHHAHRLNRDYSRTTVNRLVSFAHPSVDRNRLTLLVADPNCH